MNELAPKLHLKRHSFQYNGFTTVYWRAENGAPPLILLHGLTGNHLGLLWLAQQLPQYDVIVPDIPGHGESPVPDQSATIDDLADWLKVFVQQWPDAVIVTHSFSGAIALRALKDNPDLASRCVLLNPVPQVSLLSRAYRWMLQHSPAWASLRIEASPLVQFIKQRYIVLRRTPENMAIYDYLKSNGTNDDEHVGYYLALGAHLEDPIFREPLGACASKVWCVVGSSDAAVSRSGIELLRSTFGENHVLTCLQTGHLMPIEAPADTAGLIVQALDASTEEASEPATEHAAV
ncbi:MAG: alpha/beta fold hydrolase [Candidatus Saccharimonadales bacterium]